MRACYLCWDRWLSDWEARMVAPDNHTIPLVATVGNHDVGENSMDGAYDGVFPFSRADDPDMPLYLAYFPHQNDSGELLAPHRRTPHHAKHLRRQRFFRAQLRRCLHHVHVVGTSTVI
eukprot:gene56179-28629_t